MKPKVEVEASPATRETIRRAVTTATLTMTIVLLSACGSGTDATVTEMSPQQSKAQALATEQEIVARLPKDAVDSVDPSRGGTLFSCPGERSYSRAAGVKIHVVEGTDPATLLPALAESYTSDDRFQVRDVDTDYGTAIQLVGRYGEGYVVGTTGGENALAIDSYSPCFTLPEKMSPFDDI